MAEPAPHHEEPSFATELVRCRLGGFAWAGLLAGAIDGAVRALGVDPSLFLLQADHFGIGGALSLGLPDASDLPAVLVCVARCVFVYSVIAVAIGVLPAAALTALRRARGAAWRGSDATFGRAFGLGLGVWLAVALYWWTRPVVFPGLPATDPKRVAAAAAILVVGVGLGLAADALRGKLLGAGSRRTLGGALLTACVIGAVMHGLRSSASGDRGRLNDRNRDLPNVLLVVVDALRQDTLGAYGHAEAHTPNIDRLADEGVLFENAFAPTPFTWPSFGSILTGKVPRRHGLMRMEPGLTFPVNATLPLLLEMAETASGATMQETDWAQGAFMTGTLSHGSGLLDGFDVYLEALVGHDLVDVHDRWSQYRSGLLPYLVLNKLQQKSDRHLVTTTAERWLDRHSERRFMAMVHLYSTHTPYDPAPEFRERHLDASYDGPFESFVAAHREAIEDGKYDPTPADVKRIQRLYLAGVEEADAMIGRLVSKLESLGVLDDTIVVVTSDHGESLGEHGLWEHNWMYDDNLRVPLVMRFPRGLPAGKRVGAFAGLIDIVPTVLDLMDVAPPITAEEAERIARDSGASVSSSPLVWEAVDGASLVPLANGDAVSVRPMTFAENGLFLSVQDARWKLIVRREAVRPAGFERLVTAAREGGERPRLFEISGDPLELRPRFDPDDEAAMLEAERLFDELVRQSERLPIRIEEVARGGRDLRAEQLFRQLGYADGVGVSSDDLERGDDEND